MFIYLCCFDTLRYHKKYGKDIGCLDDRQHELMVEATRFTVLFVFTWILNFMALLAIIALISVHEYFNTMDGTGSIVKNIQYMMITIALYFKEIASLIAVRLSWKFSHSRYEKICGKCDSFTKECCQSLVRRNNEKVAHEINIPLIQSSNANNPCNWDNHYYQSQICLTNKI